jgi:curli production assembly/transport component CsgF
MKYLKVTGLFLIAVMFFTVSSHGQDFVYSPKNPAFGGSYLNYQWMLNSANAQNKLKGESQQRSFGGDFYGYDPVQNFQQNLQRRFFSELSSQVINSYFGDGQGQQDLEDGSYQFGNYKVDVFRGQQGVNIRIKDFRKGSETTITLPYY